MMSMNNYYITYENDEKILNINLNFNQEISNIGINKITQNLENKILSIAKRLKTKKVNILVNGLLVSTLLIAPTATKSGYKDTITFLSKNTIKNSFNTLYFEDIPKVIEETPKIENKIEETKTNANANTKTNKVTNTTAKKGVKTIETIKAVDTSNLVTIYRSNGTILEIELEEYLIGVVASEMPASFNIEALKAQAIVARTYALKRINDKKVLTDTTSTQVYKDNGQLKQIWKNDYDKYYQKIKNAVDSTKGLVITYNGKLIDAVYHSTSNGKTEDSIYVWGYSLPYLKSVDSEFDKNVSSYKRTITIDNKKLENILNTAINKDTKIDIERNNSNRITNITINDKTFAGIKFRSLLGLRSTDFTLEISGENTIITTYGYGHGVGMSQYGSNEMAKKGYNYKDILTHYYTNIKIIKK